MRIVIAAAAIIALASAHHRALAEDAPDTTLRFPGGANSITETHDDWSVWCDAASGEKRCVVSQTLGTREGRQAIAAMEVVPTGEGGANAVLTMPFGLDLREGVRVDLDNGALAATAQFSACTEQGCLIDLDMGPQELPLFRDGEALVLNAKPQDGDESLTLTFSLRGFASALDRAVDLVD